MYHFDKMRHDVTKCIPQLIEELRADGDIVALYLFGSFAAGKQTPVSDIDLAVILDHDFPPKRCFEKKLALLATITSLLKTDEVDLVILNQAPPALAYRILGEGRLLYEKESGKAQRVRFQVKTFDRYFDFKPVEKILHAGLVRRIKEDRFGG